MLSLSQARAMVEDILRKMDEFEPGELVVLGHETIERPSLWVFFYTSRLYLETGDLSHALAGNAPYIVNRLTGEITGTGTAYPVDYYVSRYEAGLSW